MSLGADVPEWLREIPEWLAESAHAWADGLLTVVAALCATCLAKAQRSAGLVVVSVLAMAVSVQSGSNFVSVLWTLLWTLIPVVLALGISAYRHALLGRKRLRRAQDYLPRIVLEGFALAAALFALDEPLGASGVIPRAPSTPAGRSSEFQQVLRGHHR